MNFGAYSLKMRSLYIFILFLSLVVFSNCKDMRVPKEEKKREKYYNKIIEQSLAETNSQAEKKLNLKYDEEGFYLANKEDYKAKDLLVMIQKDNIISGCDFFPFRDYITGLIAHYGNQNSQTNKNVAIPLFTLVYQMLYWRFGNKDRATKYYSSKLKFKTKDEFYNYELKDGVKDYMLNISIEKGNSAFDFSEEDIQLAMKLGLSLTTYDSAIGVFEFVYKYINNLKDEVQRESIFSIVNNKEYFLKYTDYVLRNAIRVSVNQYADLYDKESKENYIAYQKNLNSKFKFFNEVCLVLMPVVDLLRHEEQLYKNDSEKTRLNMSLKPEFGIGLALDKNIPKNSKLGHNMSDSNKSMTMENVYLEYGTFLSNLDILKISVPFSFIKSDFTKKKADFCKLLGCGGFNIDYLMLNKIDSFDHDFLIDENINNSLLNMFKLVQFEDSKLSQVLHLKKFEKFAKFDNNVEMKALNSYINLIRRVDAQTGDYLKIVEDLNVLKSLTNENDPKSSSSLERKINLLSLAAEKKKILSKHLSALYQEFEYTMLLDLKRIKHNFYQN